MSSQSGKTYEMLWDCQFCGTTKLPGKTHRFCPNCGSPQNPDSRYFPADNEKVAVEDHVFVGVDKTCAKCGQLNAGNAEFCQQCGAPLTDAAQAKVLAAEAWVPEGTQRPSSGPRDVVKEQFDAEMQRVGVQKKKNEGQVNWKLYAVLGVIALVVVAGLVALFWKKEVTVIVTGHEWSREIRIEQYNSFTEQSWWDVRPAGDDVIRGMCHQEQRSTRQIPDGEECSTRRVDQGDGTFREERECHTKYRSEPVYDDMCTWTGKRWEYDRTVPASGKSVKETPYWPQITLNCSGQRSVGCEREAGRSEAYLVVFRGDGDIVYKCPFSQSDWENVGIESVWTVNVRVVDQDAADCDSLKLKNG